MQLTIGFAYNEKPAEDAEPPSSPGSPAGRATLPSPPPAESSPAANDLFAEWDSPETIAAVEEALARAGTVVRLEANAEFPRRLRDSAPDIVFNIAEGLYGPNREAHVPAICEFYDIPYTGSDPLTLCLALDKQRAKECFVARGVPTARYAVVTRAAELEGTDLPCPAVVKPLYEGSSKGIPDRALGRTVQAIHARVREVLHEYRQPALVEEFLPGREFTCAILGNGERARTLPVVEVMLDALPAGAAPIYGYEAKWTWDSDEDPLEIFACPARVDAALEGAITSAALAAYHALGCRDWGRVDLRLDSTGAPHVLEINPLPGILPRPEQNSCFPKAARAAGLEYEAMILAVLDHALERYGRR